MDGSQPRILITGAAGFLGRWAVGTLASQGLEIHAVSTRATNSLPDCRSVVWHKADLLEPTDCMALIQRVRPTHLIHFAWSVVPGQSYFDSLNYQWVEASLRLLRVFRENGGVRSVFLGSCAEYDVTEHEPLCDEYRTPLVLASVDRGTPYGICKASLGRMSVAYAAQTGLLHAWARVFFQFGPSENPARLIPYVILSILSGQKAECSPGTQIRSFMFSPDVGAACAALLLSKVEGYVNIGSGMPVTIAEILRKISTKLNRPELIILGSKPLSAFDPPRVVPATSRLTQEVGWNAYTNLDEALDRTIEWWRRNQLGNAGDAS